MKSPRNLAAVFCVLAFAVAPAHALAQSGAGDDQYQDPFAGQNDGGGSNSGSSNSGSSNSGGSSDSGTSSGDSGAGLSTSPPDSSLTTPPPLDGTAATAATAAQATLPNTGVDTRLLVGAGIALLLVGIGLRLRTADERRY